MCSTPRYSESGKPCGVQRCEEYEKLSAREDELNALCLDYQMDLDAARQEIAALKQEAADWRSAKYVAESKETAVHLALNDMRKERDALLKVRDELIDIAHGQTMFDEFNKRYTHSFMSDGEALWRLLGFDDKRPYIPEAEFNAAVQRFKDKEARDDRV